MSDYVNTVNTEGPTTDAPTVEDLLSGLSDAQRLDAILSGYAPSEWLDPEGLLPTIAQFRHRAASWGFVKAKYRECGGNARDLEAAVDEWLSLCDPKPAASAPTPAATRPVFQPITAPDLYVKDLPPLDYVIEEILPVGATLSVGRAKDGKSLMMWNLLLAVAEGGLAFGRYQAQQGDCLYLALEDGERRAKKRLIDQMQASGMTDPPSRLSLVLWDAPRLGEGLEEALNAWLDAHVDAKFIVIDILEKVRPRRTRHGSVYQDDYFALAPLQRLAQERGIALMVVHHANKVKADDFRDSISGSMSLAGAADTLWILQRLAGEADAALRITGRDIETLDLALRFEDGFWTSLGDADTYRLSQASQDVLEALRHADKPLTPKQLAGILGVQESTMRTRLVRMTERGEVLSLGDGRYIPRQVPSSPCTEGVADVAHVAPVADETPGAALVHEDLPQEAPPVDVAMSDDEVTAVVGLSTDEWTEETESTSALQEDVMVDEAHPEPVTAAPHGVRGHDHGSATPATGATAATPATPLMHIPSFSNGTHDVSASGAFLVTHTSCRHRRISPDAECLDCGYVW